MSSNLRQAQFMRMLKACFLKIGKGREHVVAGIGNATFAIIVRPSGKIFVKFAGIDQSLHEAAIAKKAMAAVSARKILLDSLIPWACIFFSSSSISWG